MSADGLGTAPGTIRGEWSLDAPGVQIAPVRDAVVAEIAGWGYEIVDPDADPIICIRRFLRRGLRRTDTFRLAFETGRGGVRVHVSGMVWTPLLARLRAVVAHRPGPVSGSVSGSSAGTGTDSGTASGASDAWSPTSTDGHRLAGGSVEDAVDGAQPRGEWSAPSVVSSGLIDAAPSLGDPVVGLPPPQAPADDDRTVIRGIDRRPPAAGDDRPGQVWRVVFDSGEAAALGGGAIVIGRSPTAELGGEGASTLRIDDLSLSKTHALVGLAQCGPWVVDLHSTNGVVLEHEGGSEVCPPGHRVVLPAGARVALGDRVFTVVRS